MSDCIKLDFKNAKTIEKENILFGKGFPIKISEKQEECTRVIFTYGNNQVVFDEFLSALAEYIIKKYEKKLLKNILLRNYGNLKLFQLQEIVSCLPELEHDKETDLAARISVVKKGLYDYFKENSSASVDGLVTFRLQNYAELLNRVAEQVFDIYLTHKEYEEFIGLLRYFVNVQSTRPHLMHLIVHCRGMYTILNENKEDITAECISDFARPEEIGSDDFDDLLISMLITLAPEKIVVHNSVCIKNAELFDTVNKVFGKVEYCSGCEMCTEAF